MKTRYTYDREEAMQQFRTMLRIWRYNVDELRKKSNSNARVLEILQSLDEAILAVEEWSALPGSIQIVLAYQPGMFSDFDDRYEDKGIKLT